MYVTDGTKGSPSRGVCVLMKRLPVWASSRPKISSSVRTCMSSHGEIVPIEGSSTVSRSSMPTIC